MLNQKQIDSYRDKKISPQKYVFLNHILIGFWEWIFKNPNFCTFPSI